MSASDEFADRKERDMPLERGLMHLPHMAAETKSNMSRARPRVCGVSVRCWLVKFAPFRTSWREIVRRGTFTLRGVRSPVARKHLSEMRVGNLVLFYHSQQELAVVGVMKVIREYYREHYISDDLL